MQSDLSQLVSHQDIVPLTFLVLSFVAGTVIWFGRERRRSRQFENEMALKQDMLDRGMSADEIERVVRASAEMPSAARSDTRTPA